MGWSLSPSRRENVLHKKRPSDGRAKGRKSRSMTRIAFPGLPITGRAIDSWRQKELRTGAAMPWRSRQFGRIPWRRLRGYSCFQNLKTAPSVGKFHRAVILSRQGNEGGRIVRVRISKPHVTMNQRNRRNRIFRTNVRKPAIRFTPHKLHDLLISVNCQDMRKTKIRRHSYRRVWLIQHSSFNRYSCFVFQVANSAAVSETQRIVPKERKEVLRFHGWPAPIDGLGKPSRNHTRSCPLARLKIFLTRSIIQRCGKHKSPSRYGRPGPMTGTFRIASIRRVR